MRIATLAASLCVMAIHAIASPAIVRAQTVNDVRETLSDLQRWVESDPVAGDELWRGENGWYKYLGVPQLKQALLLYPHGDRAALELSLSRLEGEGDSLKMAVPQRLRNALKAFLASHSDSEMGRVAAQLRQALEQTGDVDPKVQLESAKGDVAAAMQRVDALLAKWPLPNQAGWREYLRWPLLAEELQPDHVPYSLRLRKIRRLLSQNHNGLEHSEFRQLSEALRRLIDATAFYELHFPLVKVSSDEDEGNPGRAPSVLQGASAVVDEEEEEDEEPAEDAEPTAPGERVRKPVAPQEVYHQIVGSLLHRLSYGGLRGDGRQNGELGFDLAMGYQYPRIRPLVADIRKQLLQPSLHVSVTEAFVNELGSLPINQTMQVQETILGAQMSGTSQAVGRTSVQLTPDPNRISADYLMNSRVYSHNTGVRGKIVARSTSSADVSGLIKAHVDMSGLTIGSPSVNATTNTNIDSVQARTLLFPHLISRIATHAANKQLPRAEYEASRKTEQRISREFSKQAGERVGKINQVFRERITPFIERRGDIEGLHLHSTDISAHAQGRITDDWQVTTNAPPPGHHLSGPIIVRIHESLVNNWLETEFAGNIMQVTGSSFEFAEDLGLKGPNREPCPEDAESENEKETAAEQDADEPQEDEDSDSTDAQVEEKPAPGTLSTNSILLASKVPIALSFDHDKIRVHAVIDRAIGKELTQQIDSPLEISAIYRINRVSGAIELDRIGGVEVNFFDPSKNNSFTSREYGMKVLLQKRVSRNVLRCKFNVTRIVDRLMARMLSKNSTMTRLRDYQVTNVESEGGWLSLALDRKPKSEVVPTGTPTLAPVLVSPSKVSP